MPSIDGERQKAGTTVGCSCRVGALADWNGIAVCRYNVVSYEGSIAKCEKLTV